MAAEEFKKENGNEKISNSEMLMYIVKRIDELPCEKHIAKIEESISTIKMWKWFAGIVITITYSILLGVLWFLMHHFAN